MQFSDEELDAMVSHKPVVTWPSIGVSMKEAAAAFALMAKTGITLAPDPIGDSSDGIEPCGYEDLK